MKPEKFIIAGDSIPDIGEVFRKPVMTLRVNRAGKRRLFDMLGR